MDENQNPLTPPTTKADASRLHWEPQQETLWEKAGNLKFPPSFQEALEAVFGVVLRPIGGH